MVNERDYVAVLGVDPGLANLGICLSKVYITGRVLPIEVAAFESAPSPHKAKVHASHDIMRRAGELARFLRPYVYGADIVAHEGISIPRNSSATLKLGIAFGIIQAVAEVAGKPVLQASTLEVQRSLCEKGQKGKDPRIASIQRWFPGLLDNVRAACHEHVTDAVGVVLAVAHDPLVRALAGARNVG